MMPARPALLVVLLLLAAPLQAITYKWVDENGTVVYSQSRPPAGVPYETIDTGRPRPPASTPRPKTRSSFLEQVEKEKAAKKKEGIIQSEMEKGAAVRRKNCEAARKNLQTYTAHKRILQKDGSVVRLDDNERQKKIEEAKEAIKEFCD